MTDPAPPEDTTETESRAYPTAGAGQPGVVGRPFRSLGRTWTLEEWSARDSGADEHVDRLTALGYGEPTFAAFYPNCRNVFGFRDPDPIADASSVTYTVVGWYRDPDQDICGSRPSLLDLEKDHRWVVARQAGSPAPPAPERALCFARLVVQSTAADADPRKDAPLAVAVGSTGTEALSAYLAHTYSTGDDARRELEDQLEALHLSPVLEHRRVDVGPKFLEARHEKGFRAVAGGSIWTIRPVQTGGGAADATHAQPQVTLPIELAHALNQLNVAQQQYDAARAEVEGWRERLFADWYKYMLCAYPPSDQAGDYPDVDEVKDFIERYDLAPLREAEARAASLGASVAERRDQVAASLPDIQLITTDDIGDWRAFLEQLRAQGQRALDGARDLARAPDGEVPGPEAMEKIVSALNDLMGKADLRADLDFPSAVPPEAARLRDVPQPWSREVTLRYGRLLMQALFPALARRAPHALDRIAGPRFWEPNEPVVLLVGDAVEPMDRHGLGAAVRCRIHSFDDDRLDTRPEDVDAAINAARSEGLAGFDTCERQPWQPMLLEWEVELYPTGGDRSNLDPAQRAYQPDFIRASHELAENAVDLAPRASAEQTRGYCVYAGRSILTPQAKLGLRRRIDDYLEKRPLGDDFTDFVMRLSAEWLTSDFHALSQALSGFNAALLGHKQTMQLPILDPLGFDDYQDFAARVRDAVQGANRVAPQPSNDFNPIRSGALRIQRLRLIDTFGQTRDVDTGTLLPAAALRSPQEPSLLRLPPRLVQPARLTLRWLSAGHGPGHEAAEDQDDVEMNSHPATSPVCGWLLPNNLDDSLMCHDAAGRALGSLVHRDGAAAWRPAPGRAGAPASPDEIDNPHLRRIVTWLCKPHEADPELLSNFISALDSALESIDPDSFQAHQDLALLMGRPLAVVRAAIGLEQKGLEAVNHDWTVFRQDLQTGVRESDRVREVLFPVRLGEHRQLDDGLAGYFRENADGSLIADPEGGGDVRFHSPQSSDVGSQLIVTYASEGAIDKLSLSVCLDAAPQVVTMLVDPRGKVHATSGVLPTKAIDIPPDQFAAALQALEVTFLSAPILTRDQPQKVLVPLSPEAGYEWSWVDGSDRAAEWAIDRVGRQADFAGRQVAREGWMKLRPASPPGSR